MVTPASRSIPPHSPLCSLLQDALDFALALLDGLFIGAFYVKIDLTLSIRELVTRRLVEALCCDCSASPLIQVSKRVPMGDLQIKSQGQEICFDLLTELWVAKMRRLLRCLKSFDMNMLRIKKQVQLFPEGRVRTAKMYCIHVSRDACPTVARCTAVQKFPSHTACSNIASTLF